MKKYEVYFDVTFNCSEEVEAFSKEEAKEKAIDQLSKTTLDLASLRKVKIHAKLKK